MSAIRFDVGFDTSHPDALAVYCSDGRFGFAIESLLAHIGRKRLDTLTIPGGAALLHLWSAGHSEAETVRGAASFLIEGHKIRYVALVAHAGCGYYKKRYPQDTPERIYERQCHDLKQASTWLAGKHRTLKVEGYYAVPHGGIVDFTQIPL